MPYLLRSRPVNPGSRACPAPGARPSGVVSLLAALLLATLLPGAGLAAPASVELELIESARTARLAESALSEDRADLLLEDGAVPIRDVLRIRFRSAPAVAREELSLRLADGSRLHGSIEESDDPDLLRLRLPSLDSPIALPLEWVREIGRGDGAAPEDGEVETDAVVTEGGATIRGVIESITRDGVEIEDDGLGLLQLPWAQIVRVRVAPLDPPPVVSPQDLPCFAELDDGSRIRGALRELGANRLRVESPLVGMISIPTDRRASLELLLDRVAYLSDRDPVTVEEGVPFSDYFPWTWKRDRNVLGEPLRIGRETFRKGLGVHSRSSLTFALDPEDRVFRARVGIDVAGRPVDDDPRVGSVRFVVLLDGEEAYRSGDVGWASAAIPVEVPVSGHEKITLLVEMGIGHHVLDRADWGDARILRK
ncbi:MAG: NPCBM/NEW2 domain-containing protein [Planctomycetota bacterium]